jgi:hypothetical protein
METFKVWLGSMGDAAQIRVDGRRHAHSLFHALEAEGYHVSEPQQLEGTAKYSLHAKYHGNFDHSRLQRFLETLPEIELLQE